MKSLITILFTAAIAIILIGAAVTDRTVNALDETGTPSSSQQASAPTASDPRDFGMPVPSPEPKLPDDADAYDPPLIHSSKQAPAIAAASATADRDEIVSMTGVHLDGSRFSIFSQQQGSTKGDIVTASPLRADGTAATLLLPATLAPWSMYLVWPELGALSGRPVAVNRTEAWWIGSDRATSGAQVSVYGRNLARGNGTSISYVYIKPPSAPGQYVKPDAVNPFKVDFTVPKLAPGDYEVWVHNSHGGRFGWSGPLTLDVRSQSPWAGQKDRLLSVRDFGAVGDGRADDTAALQRASQAAAKEAPAAVYFPAGTYLVTSGLTVPGNVGWIGAGRDAVEIRLGRPVGHSLIEATGRNIQFADLTIRGGGNTGDAALMQVSDSEDLLIQSVRLDAWGTAALQADRALRLSIKDSELVENGSFYGSSRQVLLSGNSFRMTGHGESAAALWGGSEFAMIGNRLSNADEARDDGIGIGRFFVAQAHMGSMRDLYWGDNVSVNAAPHDCTKVDCNKGEQICFEIVGSDLKKDFLGATEGSASFVSVLDVDMSKPGGHDLVIVGGRGAGQYRHITKLMGRTMLIDTPWNVVPDKTSRFALAATASRIAIYNNRFDGRASYSQHDSDSTAVLLYGNVYDAVVDHNSISRMRHGMMTVALDSTHGLAPYFLQYSNNAVTDSNSGLYVGTTFAETGIAGIWGGLGNVYRNNEFSNLAHIGVEYETWSHDGSDYNGTVFERNRFVNLPYGFIDAYKLMWTYDGRFKPAPESHSRKVNTILHDNTFDRGSAGQAGSVGFLTRHPDNTWLNIGSEWKGFSSGNSGPTPTSGGLPN